MLPNLSSNRHHVFLILGAFVVLWSIVSILWTLSYVNWCSYTNRFEQCSINQFYYQPEEFISKRIYQKLKSIARYEDICSQNDSTNSSQQSMDFYEAVRLEHEGKFQPKNDLGTILLPKHSKDLPSNNITNQLFLFDGFSRLDWNQSIVKLSIIGIAINQVFCGNNSEINSSILYCAFELLELQGSEKRIKASIECLPESHDLFFTSVIIKCPIPFHFWSKLNSNRTRLIMYNHTHPQRSHVSSLIKIIHSQTEHLNKSKPITVCVRPLFGTVNVLNLLEFIAFYRTNGINRIVFYYYEFNKSFISPTLKKTENFLNKFLSKIDGVELILFRLPEIIETNVHAGAQIATVHDCLHRFPNSIQLHVDIDEFLFVQKEMKTIRHWLDLITTRPDPPIAIYIPSILHCHEFNLNHSKYYEFQFQSKNEFYNNLNWKTIRNGLIVPNNARYQKTVWSHGIRSKVLLLEPKLVNHLGIHQVWSFVNKPTSTLTQRLIGTIVGPLGQYENVDSHHAILRHYRWCCNIQQSYFFQLFHFYSIQDDIIDLDIRKQIIFDQLGSIENFTLIGFKKFYSMQHL